MKEYKEIYYRDPKRGNFHAICYCKRFDTNGTQYYFEKVFQNEIGWYPPILINRKWIITKETNIKRRFPEYFI
jgi:hypothetical protein